MRRTGYASSYRCFLYLFDRWSHQLPVYILRRKLSVSFNQLFVRNILDAYVKIAQERRCNTDTNCIKIYFLFFNNFFFNNENINFVLIFQIYNWKIFKKCRNYSNLSHYPSNSKVDVFTKSSLNYRSNDGFQSINHFFRDALFPVSTIPNGDR